MNSLAVSIAAALVAALVLAGGAEAQDKDKKDFKGKGGFKGPQFVSPEVKADKTIAFRILAPKAEKVTVNSSDLPGKYQPRELKKGENGAWELALGPVQPGTFSYVFNVDGFTTADPK